MRHPDAAFRALQAVSLCSQRHGKGPIGRFIGHARTQQLAVRPARTDELQTERHTVGLNARQRQRRAFRYAEEIDEIPGQGEFLRLRADARRGESGYGQKKRVYPFTGKQGLHSFREFLFAPQGPRIGFVRDVFPLAVVGQNPGMNGVFRIRMRLHVPPDIPGEFIAAQQIHRGRRLRIFQQGKADPGANPETAPPLHASGVDKTRGR